MAFDRKDDNATNAGVKVNGKAAPIGNEEPPESSRPARSRINSNINRNTDQADGGSSSASTGRARTPGQRTGNKSEENKAKPGIKNAKLVPFVIGAVLVILIIVVAASTLGKEKQPSQVNIPTEDSTYQEPSTLSESERLKQQLEAEGYGVGQDSHGGQINVSSDSMLRDINGNSLPEMWEAKTITYINDIVQYKKYRAVTGSGVELYWLEGEYRGQSCRIIVPYTYFRNFENEGGVVCKIEVVETTDGQRVFTWFEYDHAAHTRLIGK